MSDRTLSIVAVVLIIVCALVAFVGVGAFGPTRPVRVVTFVLATAICLPFLYSSSANLWTLVKLMRRTLKTMPADAPAATRLRAAVVASALLLYSSVFVLVPAVMLAICLWQLSLALAG